MEPTQQERPSTLVPREGWPGVRVREEVNALLTAIEPDAAEAGIGAIGDSHVALLRRIARDTEDANNAPYFRRRAASALARFPSELNMALLRELALSDTDSSIRCVALISLATLGDESCLTVLQRALSSEDLLEAAAARKALVVLVNRIGQDVLEHDEPAAQDLENPRVVEPVRALPDL